jgi:hypothetical protein
MQAPCLHKGLLEPRCRVFINELEKGDAFWLLAFSGPARSDELVGGQMRKCRARRLV